MRARPLLFGSDMTRLATWTIFLASAFGLGGCSLVVEFDRSLLVDAGTDAGVIDASVDAGSDAESGLEARVVDAD